MDSLNLTYPGNLFDVDMLKLVEIKATAAAGRLRRSLQQSSIQLIFHATIQATSLVKLIHRLLTTARAAIVLLEYSKIDILYRTRSKKNLDLHSPTEVRYFSLMSLVDGHWSRANASQPAIALRVYISVYR